MTTTNPSSGNNAPAGTAHAMAGASFHFHAITNTRTSASGHAHGSAYASAVAAIKMWHGDARALEREKAVVALEAKFETLTPALLHLMVAGVERVGPHVGNPGFSEDMLQALARYEQEKREANGLRDEARKARHWSLFEKIFVGVVAFILGVISARVFPS